MPKSQEEESYCHSCVRVGPGREDCLEFRPFKIGKYLLLERIATGGMAEVYRAKASGAGGFEKQMAIKRILPNYSSNEEFRKMFEYEARLSSMLTHANIVQVYDFVKSGETYLLAMEYVAGKNLRQFLNKAKKVGVSVPIEFAAYVINEVCKGLEYAHSKKEEMSGKALNIIHRDMSPQNVMLSYDGAVKIVDFGIAKAKDRVDETRSGVIKGKFGYMSPEQANGDQVDNRTDIFSTGIILFELLTGRRLFAAETDLATLRLIQECVIPSPGRINPKVSSDLEKVVLTALAKDMKVRFKHAGDFHRALLEYMNRHCPTYTQREVSELIQRVFADDIEAEKKRYEQLLRQSIPFSQGATPAKNEMTDVENALEGEEQTKSESVDDEPITISGAEGIDRSPSGAIEISEEKVNSDIGQWLQRPEGGTSAYSLTGEELPKDGSVSLTEPPAPGDKGKESGTQIRDEHRFTQTHQLGSIDTDVPPEPKTSTANSTPSLDYPTNFKEKGIGSYSEINRVSREPGTGRDPMREPLRDENTSMRTQTAIDRGGDRERSVSLTRPMGGQSKPTTTKSSKREALFDQMDFDPKPKKRSVFPPALTLAMLVFVTFYAYRFFFDGGFRQMIDTQDLRSPTQSAKDSSDTYSETRATTGNCAVKVESDPPGADVFVGEENRGITPTTVTGACGTPMSLSLRMTGYENMTESLVMRQAYNDFYRVMKRIPVGTLELMVDRNVDVYINGNKVGTADANQVFEKRLRANQTYEMKLVNTTFKLETEKKITISEGKVLQVNIRLEDSRSISTSPKR